MLFPHLPALAVAIPGHLLRPKTDAPLCHSDVFTVKYMSYDKKLEIPCQTKADTIPSFMELTVSGGDGY